MELKKHYKMPDKIIAIIDSVFFTIISWFMLITWFSFIAIIPVILSTFYWVVKIKRDIDNKYDGSILKCLKSIVKKNK